MKTGVFLGRFQPFHKGHLDAIQQILKEVDCIKILIGSSNQKRNKENPLTYAERKRYIQKILKGKRYSILPLPDTDSDREWLNKLKKTAGYFDRAYLTDNPWTEKILQNNNVPYRKTKKRISISATKIRAMMRENKKEYSKFLASKNFPKTLQKIIQETA
jgi:nicotinamide-nucleotide adenylyltransferase